MEVCAVGAELFYTDRQTDMMKLTVAFLNFSERGQKCCCPTENCVSGGDDVPHSWTRIVRDVT